MYHAVVLGERREFWLAQSKYVSLGELSSTLTCLAVWIYLLVDNCFVFCFLSPPRLLFTCVLFHVCFELCFEVGLLALNKSCNHALHGMQLDFSNLLGQWCGLELTKCCSLLALTLVCVGLKLKKKKIITLGMLYKRRVKCD